jgi:hypothetical protein
MYIFTQLVGNPLDMPVIKADSSFTGLYLLDGFPSPVNSTIVTTIVFYMQLRNFVFDTTAINAQSTVACINWATAQAVTLSNNHLIMPPGSMHQGIAMNGTNGGGGGSATYMGILVCLKVSVGNSSLLTVVENFRWKYRSKSQNFDRVTTSNGSLDHFE